MLILDDLAIIPVNPGNERKSFSVIPISYNLVLHRRLDVKM